LFAVIVLAIASHATGGDVKAPGPARPPSGPAAPVSVDAYSCPEWFRDAKLGIWVCWGPQSVPMMGDGYARWLYGPQSSSEKWELEHATQIARFHREHFGPPSQFGFKDVINLWKAEKWDPERLMALYKRAGARYFVALAADCDNFDLWNSSAQPWNAVAVGPKKDVVGLWAAAARKHNLPFGVSLRSSRAWYCLNVAFASDKEGAMAYIPFDGHLTRADGRGKWWDGLDPRDLYGRPRQPTDPPDPAFVEEFYARARDLVEKYDPDLISIDDTQFPFDAGSVSPADPPSKEGLRFLVDYYGARARLHEGNPNAVVSLKIPPEDPRPAVLPDIEYEPAVAASSQPWQTTLSIGDWHYEESNTYKSAGQIIRTLVDVVSKNGNLLLNLPLRPEGTLDDREVRFLEELADWMKINSEAIHATRPWVVCGEGPTQPKPGQLTEQLMSYTARDIRFTARGDRTLYAILLQWPAEASVIIRSLAKPPQGTSGKVEAVKLLGYSGRLRWSHTADGLTIRLPKAPPCPHAASFKVTVDNLKGFRPEAFPRP
jgi:alpha-L-fucosidase